MVLELSHDGTIKSLSELYQTHDESKFKAMRYQVQVDYARRLRVIEETIGEVRVNRITFIDLERWFKEFEEPHDGGRPKKATARLILKILKQIFLFGKLALPGNGQVPHNLDDLRAAAGISKPMPTEPPDGEKIAVLTRPRCR